MAITIRRRKAFSVTPESRDTSVIKKRKERELDGEDHCNCDGGGRRPKLTEKPPPCSCQGGRKTHRFELKKRSEDAFWVKKGTFPIQRK